MSLSRSSPDHLRKQTLASSKMMSLRTVMIKLKNSKTSFSMTLMKRSNHLKVLPKTSKIWGNPLRKRR